MRTGWQSMFVLLTLLDILTLTSAVRWLSIATIAAVDHVRQEEECDRLGGLVKRQRQICKRNMEMMDAVKAGAVDSIAECQFQFRNRRWNCSTVNAATIFGRIVKSGTRETAFVHAISAAGVAHAVTRACSSGRLDRCGCDRTVDVARAAEGFQWAGCSDNVAYGSAFSKSFVDARERRAKGRDSTRSLMNLHNNNAGRKAIEDFMRVQCKCHGVSGSCELKTCWRSMPPFREVGATLRDKFDGAVEVVQQRSGSRRELVARNARFRSPTDADLVFVAASPDFCVPDGKTGSLGTRGRLCNRASAGTDGCELMCCGRGFQTRRRVVVERCRCKFHWCCFVRCQKCRIELEEHVCR